MPSPSFSSSLSHFPLSLLHFAFNLSLLFCSLFRRCTRESSRYHFAILSSRSFSSRHREQAIRYDAFSMSAGSTWLTTTLQSLGRPQAVKQTQRALLAPLHARPGGWQCLIHCAASSGVSKRWMFRPLRSDPGSWVRAAEIFFSGSLFFCSSQQSSPKKVETVAVVRQWRTSFMFYSYFGAQFSASALLTEQPRSFWKDTS